MGGHGGDRRAAQPVCQPRQRRIEIVVDMLKRRVHPIIHG
jgi:hypothetical protein